VRARPRNRTTITGGVNVTTAKGEESKVFRKRRYEGGVEEEDSGCWVRKKRGSGGEGGGPFNGLHPWAGSCRLDAS